ncbi:MAG: pyridoxal-phosphate dependent enzyme [Verrucomicrobiota bacterium]
MVHRLKIENIRTAVTVIDPVFQKTPQYVAESLSQSLGARIVVKVETANPIRCFKGRGADYYVSKLQPGERLITASAGNLGQAMAYACRRRGIQLTVYASTRANPFKVDRMRAFGAEVVLFGNDFDDAKIEAKHAAAQLGIRMVEDSLDPETGEGAGTIGLELATFPEPLDAVLVAFGNGALACGMGVALKALTPRTRVIAVQAAGAPAMLESWRQGKIVAYDSISTIADGIGIRIPIPECVADMHGVIDEGFLVREESLIAAMRLAHQHLGLVVEPSGAAGLAALIEHKEAFAGQTVAIVICGGNLTPDQMRSWLQ